MGTLRQFIEVVLLAVSGTCITVAGAIWKFYELSTIGVLLLVVGTVLFFVRGPRYFDESLMNASTFPFLKSMNDFLDGLDVKGKSLILPSNSPIGFSQMLIVGEGKSGLLEGALLSSAGGGSMVVLNADGGEVLRLTPLGNDLAVSIASRIAEEKHQTLAQMFQRVEDVMADMGAVTSLGVTQDGATVKVVIEGAFSHFSCPELGKYPRICSQLLCPICSSLACLVSHFSKCPVAVEGAGTIGGKTELSVRIIEEGEGG